MKAEILIAQDSYQSPGDPGKSYLTRRRALIVISVLLIALFGFVVVALSLGSERVASWSLLSALVSKLTGTVSPLSREQDVIIFSLRLPRIALAIGVGAALAVAGAAFQALLRNPLADPYVLGVSGGAALGSITAIMFASELSYSLTYIRPLFGFAGAAIVTLVVYRLGRREDDPAHLVLAGVVMSTFLSSVIALMTAMTDNVKLRNITLWLLGDLSSGAVEGLFFVIVAAAAGATALATQSRALNLMMIGERDAFAMGVETARVRRLVHLTASLLTGAAVSAGGAIGYVGLVTPHLVRLAAGGDNRLVIPASAIGGALMVLIADTIARTALAPRELPTGAITALIGAPVFVYLLLKSRK
ncbi:MAG TPA: iron ABC transporter permease [Blastocatellia bacterium]|nr:iron ABC transporter permease [Blastocatellia bacterium]